MKLKFLIVLLSISLSFISCRVNKDEVPGFYVSQNNVNTIDSLWIEKDGSYINLMYRKNDNTLVYRNTGKWEYDSGYIIFHDFFSDEDDVHSHSQGNFEEVLMWTQLQLNKKRGNVIIRHKSMYEHIYFEKQD